MKRVLIGVALFSCPTIAIAANWTPIPGTTLAYVDMASVRHDTFPKPGDYGVALPGQTATYMVAWIRVLKGTGQVEATDEVIFDYKGNMGVMQQIIDNESKDSEFHSFDMTQSFRISGVRFRTIVPDSLYDGAQLTVCKKR